MGVLHSHRGLSAGDGGGGEGCVYGSFSSVMLFLFVLPFSLKSRWGLMWWEASSLYLSLAAWGCVLVFLNLFP